MRKSPAVLIVALLVSSCATATSPPAPSFRPAAAPMQHLIPRPAVVDFSSNEAFTITSATTVHDPAGDEHLLRIGRFLTDLIGLSAGPERLEVVSGAASSDSGSIPLQIGEVRESGELPTLQKVPRFSTTGTFKKPGRISTPARTGSWQRR